MKKRNRPKALWCTRSLMTCAYSYTLCVDEEMYEFALKQLRLPRAEWPPFMATDRANATTHFIDSRIVDGATTKRLQAAVVCIAIDDRLSRLQHYALLVHEAVHVWRYHCRAIGDNAPSEESEAYGIQRIAQSLMDGYDKVA